MRVGTKPFLGSVKQIISVRIFQQTLGASDYDEPRGFIVAMVVEIWQTLVVAVLRQTSMLQSQISQCILGLIEE
jgi:hypothetical protein